MPVAGRTPRPSATLWRVIRDPRYAEIAELAAPETLTFEKASDKSPVTRSPSETGTAKFNAQLAQLHSEPPTPPAPRISTQTPTPKLTVPPSPLLVAHPHPLRPRPDC